MLFSFFTTNFVGVDVSKNWFGKSGSSGTTTVCGFIIFNASKASNADDALVARLRLSTKHVFIFLKIFCWLLAIPNVGMLPSSKLDVLFLVQLLPGFLLLLILGNVVVGSVSSVRL